jgi:hypothetical protein
MDPDPGGPKTCGSGGSGFGSGSGTARLTLGIFYLGRLQEIGARNGKDYGSSRTVPYFADAGCSGQRATAAAYPAATGQQSAATNNPGNY